MKKYINILLCLFLTQSGIAQTNQIGLDLGYQRTGIFDKQASPLTYRSSQKMVSLNYLHSSVKSEFAVKVGGALGKFVSIDFNDRKWYNPGTNPNGTPKNDSSKLTGKLYNPKFKVGYRRQVYSGDLSDAVTSRLLVGASINDQAFYSTNIVRVGWLNALSLNADISYQLTIKKRNRFRWDASVPIAGINTRLPYHNTISSPSGRSNIRKFISEGSEFAHVGNFQNIQFSLGYDYAVSQRVGLGIKYSGQWLRYSKQLPVRMFEQSIGISFNFKF